MSGAPYSQIYIPDLPELITIPITDFLASSGTVPTASSSCVQYIVNNKLVTVQFKYVIATVGNGNYLLNLPIPISTICTAPQGSWSVRYSTTKVHFGFFIENSSPSKVAMVASRTFGGAPDTFTSASPNAGLAAGDIVTGQISYIID